jgi:WD40 repeat protein
MRLAGHDGPVLAAEFSADGALVLTASSDQTLAIWDCASATRLARIFPSSGPVAAVAMSPDGTRLASASTGAGLLWDVSMLTRNDVAKLADWVCRERLSGASTLTAQDIERAGCLGDRVGEDVSRFLPPSWADPSR